MGKRWEQYSMWFVLLVLFGVLEPLLWGITSSKVPCTVQKPQVKDVSEVGSKGPKIIYIGEKRLRPAQTLPEERKERIEAVAFDCSKCPRTCAEYTSCEFAKFCAFRCGLLYLDGDNDGIPCEWGPC